jgi:two-component system cell cycle sensor histidine kinase/response regulator CckA
MFGYDDPSQVVGRNAGCLSEGRPPYDEAAAKALIDRAAAGEPQLFEWRAKARDGRLFWVEVNMRRARIGGERDRVLVVARDISERKRVEPTPTGPSAITESPGA